MKHPLSDILSALEEQNKVLSRARHAFLAKDAERKYFEANLIKNAQGKSHAEKVMNAHAENSYLEFMLELAKLDSVYEFEKFKASVMEKEWQSQYLALKQDGDGIKRLGSI